MQNSKNFNLTPQQLLNFLTHLGSSNNAHIQQSTNVLKSYFKNPQSMLSLMTMSNNEKEISPEIRQLCFIFLRQYLIKLWSAYDQTTQAQIKSALLSHYSAQSDHHLVLRSQCHAIASLAKIGLGNDEWPELLNYILQSLDQQSKNHSLKSKKAAMELLSNIIQYVRLTKEVYLKTFTNLLSNQLQSKQISLRILAVKSLTNLFENQRITPKMIKYLQPLIPLMIAALVKDQKDITLAVFEILCDLIEIKDFLNPHLPQLVSAGVQLISLTINKSNDDDDGDDDQGAELRELAAFFLQQVAKFAGDSLTTQMVQQVMEIAFQLCDTKPSSTSQNDDQDEYLESINCEQIGSRLIGFYSQDLKNSVIFPILSNLVDLYMKNEGQDPYKVRAAIMALGAMSEGCKQKVKPFIKQITQSILQKVQHDCRNDVIVAEQAALTFAEFSQYIVPEFLDLYEEVLPSMMKVMRQSGSQDVQSKMLFAISKFCEQIIDQISGLSEQLLKSLIPFLDQNKYKRQIRYQAITAIQSVCGIAPDQIGQYFEFLIQKLAINAAKIQIGEESEQKYQHDYPMAAAAISACGRLAIAVGKEAFEPYKYKLSEIALVACQAKSSELKQAGFGYFSKIVQVYESQIQPMLGILVPLLLKSVTEGSGLKVIGGKSMRQKKNRVQDFSLDSDSEPENDKEGGGGDEFKAQTGDVIEYQNPILDEKCSAIHCLGRLCLFCTKPMLEFYQKIVISFDQIDPHFCDQVRYQMVESFSQLIVALQKLENPQYQHFKRLGDSFFDNCYAAVKKENVSLFRHQIVQKQNLSQNTLKLWNSKVRQHIFSVILTDQDRQVVSHAIETLQEMIHILGPGLLSEEDKKSVTKLLISLFSGMTNCQEGQYQTEAQEAADQDDDDEYVDQDDDDNEKDDNDDDQDMQQHDQDIMGAACDLVQQICRTYGDSFASYLIELIDLFWKFTTRQIGDQRMIVGMFAQMINSVPSLIPKLEQKYQILQYFVQILQNHESDNGLVRNSVYALAVLIMRAPQMAINYGVENFQNLFQEVFMFWVGNQIDGKKSKKLEMRDNILGAFGRIAMIFPQNSKMLQYTEEIIKSSPLLGDEMENTTALRVVLFLKEQIKSNEALKLLDQYWQNIIQTIIKILTDEKCDASKEGIKAAKYFLKELLESGGDRVQNFIQEIADNKLKNSQKQELKRVLSGK